MDDDTLCKISCQIVGSVLSSANWTTLCKWSWLTLVSGKGIWLPRTGREIHTSHSRFTGIMIVFPVLIPSQNFLFPGTGREIIKCHGKRNLRLVFPGITGNGNSRSPLTHLAYLTYSLDLTTHHNNLQDLLHLSFWSTWPTHPPDLPAWPSRLLCPPDLTTWHYNCDWAVLQFLREP